MTKNQHQSMTNDKQRPTTNSDQQQTMTNDKQRPKPKNSRILGQYTHNLLGLNAYPSQFSFHPQKYGLKARSPNWVRHAKCTWSFYVLEDKLSSPKESKRMSSE